MALAGPGCVCGGAWGPGRGWPVTALSRAHWARPSRAEPSFVFVCVITLLLPDHPTGSASAADPLSLCCRRPWALSSVAARMVRSPRSPSLRRRRARSSLSPNLARGGRWTTCAFLSPARPGTNPATPGPWPLPSLAWPPPHDFLSNSLTLDRDSRKIVEPESPTGPQRTVPQPQTCSLPRQPLNQLSPMTLSSSAGAAFPNLKSRDQARPGRILMVQLLVFPSL